MSIQALPGFRDFTPPDLAIRSHVFGAMRRVSLRYGFEEWDGPPLEPLDLYTNKSGDEIVNQLYTFTDRGGRAVALRPEMTPSLARIVGPRVAGLKKPVRWFSIPQLFRYERQQRGRLKEHFQLNCDLIGEPGPLGDAEIVALAIDVMRELGLGPTDVRARISDRRLLRAILLEIGLEESAHGAAFHALDKVGRSEYAPRRAALAGAGATEAQIHRLEGLATIRDWGDLERDFPSASSTGQPLRTTLDTLSAMELGDFVDLDLTIVRGLAYYTGTVFELFDAGRSLRAICGGGRYDGLLAAVGGTDAPALGFGMGDVVLTELLKDRGLLPPPVDSVDVFVAAVGAEDRPFVYRVSHQLRDQGFRVEFALADQPLGKQLKLADARGAKAVVVIGPDDRARGEAVVKSLAAGAQRSVATDVIGAALIELGCPVVK
jgi:histidyl-tRNA synthetase